MDVDRRDDRFLDEISRLLTIIRSQEIELAIYRIIVPKGTDTPTNVPHGRTHRRAHALPQ